MACRDGYTFAAAYTALAFSASGDLSAGYSDSGTPRVMGFK